MSARFRPRLTYANVMATVAVFIALGGSSYAALRVTSRNVPKNALTGADIKNLTGKDVTNNSLTGADVTDLTSDDVTNGRLLAEDFLAGQLPKGDKGDKGETGDKGDTGDTGPTTAAANTDNGNPPAPPLLAGIAPTTITTPTAGKLFVLGDAPAMNVGCSGSPCSVDIGLYVDGQPVPGTKRSFSAAAGMSQTKSLTISGVTGTLPAGTHTVSFGRTQTSGSVVPFTNNDSHTSAIALGG